MIAENATPSEIQIYLRFAANVSSSAKKLTTFIQIYENFETQKLRERTGSMKD